MAENSTIPTNKQVLVTGTTGTGKSFLAEVYLAGYDYVVKFDTKHESDERIADGKPLWRGLKEGTDYTLVRRFEDLDDVETKKIIYCPDFEDLNANVQSRA